MKWWEYVLIVAALGTVIWFAAGCSTAASDLAARQKAIQDCILKGGLPRLGPDGTVECPIPI